MEAIAVVGMQWGDEGKGKIVDLLAKEHRCTVSVRFNGGNNAGHSVQMDDGTRYKVHLLPSAAYISGMSCVLGSGMVMDPEVLVREIDQVKSVNQNLWITVDPRAHLILPNHVNRDILEEEIRGKGSIGTTRSGNGPAYADKMSRRGIRVGDLSLPRGERDILLESLGLSPDLNAKLSRWAKAILPFVGDGSAIINDFLNMGKSVIFAGAHGTLLDIDHGTYPFVTSSNCTASAIGSGAGVDPRRLTGVVGVVKAYSTRIGTGPFPTEVNPRLAERIREVGREFGTTTGRPRRIGWLDAVALRHAVRLNRPDYLVVTLLDVLSGIDDLHIAQGYFGGSRARWDTLPATAYEHNQSVPSYEVFEGWKEDISKCRDFDCLPPAAQAYVLAIEKAAGVPVGMVSVGPGRNQVIRLRKMAMN